MTNLLELYRMADEDSITVDCFELGKREALSFMDTDGECFIAIDPFKLHSMQDETIKLAHEMGHCCTGSFYNRYAARDVRQKHENRANRWAIETLIPEEELDDAVADGYTNIFELAEHFNVTEDFMRMAVCWYTHRNLATDLYFEAKFPETEK